MKAKCRTCCQDCVHYESFFGSCNLYYEEVYMGEGEYDIRPVRVERISKSECEYTKKGTSN